MDNDQRKTYTELKLEAADTDSVRLIQGPAKDAVNCMRDKGMMPVEESLLPGPYEVEAKADGSVRIQNYGKDGAPGTADRTYGMTPPRDGKPATAFTPTTVVTGPIADEMRKEARTCAFKSIHLKP
jgi:hypothetical protein